MTLTPEERQRIYEEEKARREAQDHFRSEGRRKGCLLGCLGVLGLLLIFFLLAVFLTPSPRNTGTSVAPPEPTASRLALIGRSGGRTAGGSYIEVEGLVENISSEPIENIVAVATIYGKDGRFISSDDALIDYNPLLAGQKSPFTVMVRYNPAMATYQVTFKRLFGGVILHEDRVPEK